MKKSGIISSLLKVLLIFISVCNFSCNKPGCIDCRALNYDSKANTNDNSCQYLNKDKIGIYKIQDSILSPITMKWSKNQYLIELKRENCSSDQLSNPQNVIISNYANLNHKFDNYSFDVTAQVTNETITIKPQSVLGYRINQSTGYFSNDSLYFDIEFENENGKVFYGSSFGKKN